MQCVGLTLAQFARRDELVETRLFGGELRIDIAAEFDDALFLERHAVPCLLEHDEAFLVLHSRDHAFLGDRLLGLGLHARGFVVTLRLRVLRLLVEQFRVEIGALGGEVGLRGGDGRLRGEQLIVDFGIGKLEDHGVRLHDGAGLDDDVLDVRGGLGGDPADLLGHQRAGAAHFAQKLAALDRVDQYARTLDRRDRGTERRKSGDGDEKEGDDAGADQVLAASFALLELGAGDIHGPARAGSVPCGWVVARRA